MSSVEKVKYLHMSQESYNPKELLSVLLDVEAMLKQVIQRNCPENNLLISQDLDLVLDDFFKRQNVREDDIAYLSSQLALLHLSREIEKAKGVVIEVNDLRAFHDFNMHIGKLVSEPKIEEKKWRLNKILLGVFVGAVIGTAILYFAL